MGPSAVSLILNKHSPFAVYFVWLSGYTRSHNRIYKLSIIEVRSFALFVSCFLGVFLSGW